jgi:hypothetical protein
MKKAVTPCIAISILVLAITVGCTKKAQKVETNRSLATALVTLDGKPLPGGNVTIISAKDPIFRTTATIGPDGLFVIGDAPTGEVLIAIDTEPIRVFNPKQYVPIPAKYADVRTSGLTANITKSQNKDDGPQLKLELKSK